MIPKPQFFPQKVFNLSKGRLYQVEYALEAISHAGMSLAIQTNQGIVLAAEKKTTSKLLENISREKIYNINGYGYIYIGIFV
jgi:20S proteasome alpha/beta subunit